MDLLFCIPTRLYLFSFQIWSQYVEQKICSGQKYYRRTDRRTDRRADGQTKRPHHFGTHANELEGLKNGSQCLCYSNVIIWWLSNILCCIQIFINFKNRMRVLIHTKYEKGYDGSVRQCEWFNPDIFVTSAYCQTIFTYRFMTSLKCQQVSNFVINIICTHVYMYGH